MFCVCAEVLSGKMIQLLRIKSCQLLPISKVDQS